VPKVIIDRIRCLEPMHERRQIPLRRLNQEVDMVRHQTEQIQTHSGFLDRLSQALQKAFAVVIIIKECPSLHSANRNVINCPLKLNS